MDKTLYEVVYAFLKAQNIFVDRAELKLQISTHPSYPSLHSITGVLNHFDVSNLAMQVDTSIEILDQLPICFFTIVQLDKEKNYCLVKKEKQGLSLFNGESSFVLKEEEFLKVWTGIIVLVEKVNQTGFVKDNFNLLLKVGSGILVMTVLFSFFLQHRSLFEMSHFVLTFIGLVVSVFLVEVDLGFNNVSTEKFCSISTATSCENVLKSSVAKIYKSFKLTDASIIYFSGCLLSWLLLVQFKIAGSPLVVLSLLGIPIVVLSIYYQQSVIKKWCPLCLMVATVLFLQAASVFIYKEQFTLTLFAVGVVIFGFLGAFVFWYLLKPLLKDSVNYKELLVSHLKFKRNSNLFFLALNESSPVELNRCQQDLVLGPQQAKISMLIVTNPLCSFCKSAHRELEKLLDKFPEDLNLIIRFNIDIRDKAGIPYQVASRLFELYDNSIEDFRKALSDAYADEVNFDHWLSTWGKSVLNFDSIINIQRNWCNTNGINFTPAVYLNGKQYPKEYDRTDVGLFMEDLIDMQVSNKALMEVL